MTTRRTFLTTAAGLGAAAAVPPALLGPARAQQNYPNRPIHMIVPFPPGGPIDTMARLVGEHLSGSVGQVVVENRPGAGSTLGTKYVAAAPHDGYTLLFGSSGSLAVAPALYSSLDVDPRKAFAPIATVALLPHVFVVNNDVPAHSVAEFVAYAKANPGKINFGAGLGTPPHLLSTLFKTKAEIDVVYIPECVAKRGVLFGAGPELSCPGYGVATVPPDGGIDRHVRQTYAAQGIAGDGGGRQRNLASRRRF